MKFLHTLFGRPLSGNRFNRYYGGVIEMGAGYPTADEARRDLRAQDRTHTLVGFIR
jgi:hypothetical protein